MADRPITWFQVAKRPKWIGAFFVAMAVAAICAGLAQWQAERSFEQAVTNTQQTVARPLGTLIEAGKPAPQGAVGSLVTAELELYPSSNFIISSRVQRDGTVGYWAICPGYDRAGNLIFVTMGFGKTLSEVESIVRPDIALAALQIAQFKTYQGLLMPSEAPILTKAKQYESLSSLSLGQLVNLLPADAAKSELPKLNKTYPLFLLLTEPNPLAQGLQPIEITPASAEVQVNWLSAFYAAEWTVFCGFAFFLWWRLVRDQQVLENTGS